MKSSTKNPGQKLKTARRKRRITLKEVAETLKISTDTIKQIEEWDLQSLKEIPEISYKVRLFAKMVGLNAREYEDILNKELTKPRNKLKFNFFVFSKTSILAVAFLILALITSYTLWNFYSATSTPYLEVYSPQDKTTISENFVEISGRTSEGSRITVNGSEVLVEPDGSFESLVIVKPGANTITVKAVNSFGRETIVTRKVYKE